MMLIKALVLLYTAVSGVALAASASDWVTYGSRGTRVLMAASGFLFVFVCWGSAFVFLASR